MKATVNGTTTAYVGNYFEWSNNSWTKYYYAGTTRVAMRTSSTLYYLLGDHLGSTSIVATSTGVKYSESRYMPWGKDRYTSATPPPTAYLYTGQKFESGLGLYFYNARFYDPQLARFAQADSIVPDPSFPLSWDRYAYTRNNPVNRVDPTGHLDLLLDLLFILYDIYQITQEGWTQVNTVALAADVACAFVPIGTGGGPAVRTAMAGGDAALAFTQAAIQVPDAFRAAQAAETLFQFADTSSESPNSSSKQGHHPWPKYLLGPEKQELYYLDSKLHTEYHSQLDKFLSRRFGTENYTTLFDTQEKINQLLDFLLDFNKYFDEIYNTHTYEALEDVLRNEGKLPKPK